ncbi:germination protein [Clostridium polyendosporum]|uniref:Germination protein n=2 Tax=Clostridium polyendosporum TaxID=69208 RepID=A0A919RXK8_9CLOT|nr:germination protein [Clostridium polyendosporum]
MIMVLYQLGSALVVPLGISARQDAWEAILMGMIGGILLAFIYTYIYMKNGVVPSFQKIMTNVLGKNFGSILTFIYIMFFMYIASRVLTDFRLLLLATVLPETPVIVITILLTLPIIYACYHGAEIIGRASEIFFTIVILTLIAIYILVSVNKLVHLESLKPIFGVGARTIFKTVFPVLVAIPFGETIVFMNLFSKVNVQESIRKTVISSMVLSGILLSFTVAMNISVISLSVMERSTFPLLLTVSMVKIGEFLERFDVMAVILLMVGGSFKILTFFYSSVEMLIDLSNSPSKNRVPIIFFLGVVLVAMSGFMGKSVPEHYYVGLDVVTKHLHIPLMMIIPALLAIISFFKSRNVNRKMPK